MQTSISFYDYKLLSVAANNQDVRQGIKQCIFDGLITYALQHIAAIKVERRDLQDQRRILHAQLRARQKQGGGLSALLMQAQEHSDISPQILSQLTVAESRLESMLKKNDVLGFYLNEIVSILSKPELFIKLEVACFRLNDMGIKVIDEAETNANTVCFSELEISDVMKRVVTLISYDKSELDCF